MTIHKFKSQQELFEEARVGMKDFILDGVEQSIAITMNDDQRHVFEEMPPAFRRIVALDFFDNHIVPDAKRALLDKANDEQKLLFSMMSEEEKEVLVIVMLCTTGR